MPIFVRQEAESVEVKLEDLTYEQRQLCGFKLHYLCVPRKCSWCGCMYAIVSSTGSSCDGRPGVDHYDFLTEVGDVHMPQWVYKCISNSSQMSVKGSGWTNMETVKSDDGNIEVVLPRNIPSYDF